jgi:hypothetical protein
MSSRSHRPRPFLLLLLFAAVVYGSISGWRRANRPPGRWIGVTECSWTGRPVVTIRSGIRRQDSVGAAAHESVHVAECGRLGPVGYRWNTVRASSRLALETPAYCAGSRARVGITRDTVFERATILDDMLSDLADQLDSAKIVAALESECPQFLPQ